jgi:hypothetical protein
MKDLITDRLLNIHRGIARLDFARLESVDTEKNPATFAPSMRLSKPVDTFMQMAEQVNKVREAILDQAKPQTEKTASM